MERSALPMVAAVTAYSAPLQSSNCLSSLARYLLNCSAHTLSQACGRLPMENFFYLCDSKKALTAGLTGVPGHFSLEAERSLIISANGLYKDDWMC